MQGILVNIFGGIMRCDVIAEGVVAAVKEVGLKVPLVVRLEGTNVELGKKILNESRPDIIAADDLDDAAQKIVAAVRLNASRRHRGLTLAAATLTPAGRKPRRRDLRPLPRAFASTPAPMRPGCWRRPNCAAGSDLPLPMTPQIENGRMSTRRCG